MSTNAHPPTLRNLIDKLKKLPGLGEKSATRIAMHILRAPQEECIELAEAIRQLKSRIRACSRCFHFTDAEFCPICSDPNRDNGEICVVETSGDLLALEQSGGFKGRFHVLQGALAPLDGIGPDDIRIGELLHRVDNENVREVILATNTSNEGEATAHYIMKLLQGRPVRVTRIAYGIPMGGDLKYIDQVTLERALKGRQSLS